VDRTDRELAFPGTHDMQSLGVTDAVVGEYFPVPQGMQEAEPVVLEYEPGEQSSQEEDAEEAAY
jgi:hypothetical protein